MTSRKLSYATLLPFAGLFACWWLVLASAASAYLRLHTSGLVSLVRSACYEEFRTIEAWNLPGVLLGLPITIPVTSAWQHSSAPSIDEVWISFTSPVFCIPAWWFVGRGLDALRAGTRLHLAMRIIGTALSVLAFAGAGAILFTAGSDEIKPLLIGGTLFWTAAFGIFPAIWFFQRRRQRGERNQ